MIVLGFCFYIFTYGTIKVHLPLSEVCLENLVLRNFVSLIGETPDALLVVNNQVMVSRSTRGNICVYLFPFPNSRTQSELLKMLSGGTQNAMFL